MKTTQEMRSYASELVPPAFLVVLSMVASVFLIPSDRELALIHHKAKQFDEAKVRYEALVASGELRADVVKSMTELHLQYGEVDEAVALLERFVARNPDNYEARRVLGTYYHYAERPDAYKQNLEAMTSLGLDERTLRELSDIYNARGELDKQVEVLEALTSSFGGNPQDLLDLSYLRARLGRHEHAIQSLDDLERVAANVVTDDVMELKLNLYLDSGNDSSLEEARSWLQERRSLSLVARFAALFAFKHSAEAALELIQPYEARAAEQPALLEQLIRLDIETGQSAAAYERLQTLHDSRRLPEEAVPLLVELELSRSAPMTALSHLERYAYDIDALPDWLLGALARSTASLSDPDAAGRLTSSMPGRFFADDPVGAATLWLAAERPAAAVHALDTIDYDDLSAETDLGEIASLYLSLGHREKAYRSLLRWAQTGRLPGESLLALASLGIELEREHELVSMFEGYRNTTQEAEGAWALVALAALEDEGVAAWLGASNDPDDGLLFDLYYVAERTGQWPVAVLTAERLFERRNDDERRLLLARSLTPSGQSSRALDLLRDRIETPPPSSDPALQGEIESAYLDALRREHERHDPGENENENESRNDRNRSIAVELRAFLLRKLERADLEKQRREEFLYELIGLSDYEGALPWLRELAIEQPAEWLYAYADATLRTSREDELIELLLGSLADSSLSRETRKLMVGLLNEHARTETVLPHLKRLAYEEGADWGFAYEEALETLGRRAELISFWSRVALDTSRSSDERRGRAYRLLEEGLTDTAREVFSSLARDAPPQHADVTELLYLERLNDGAVRPETLAWLEEQARGSKAAEKAAWMRRLIEADRPRLAVGVVDGEGDDADVRSALLEAAAAAQLTDLLRRLVEREISTGSTPPRLRQLGQLALECGALDAAGLVFGRLLAVAPNDSLALKQLGLVSFMRSDYTLAKEFLSRYHATGRSDYETSYYYGEVLLRREKRAEAHYFFRRSLDQIDSQRSPSFMERATRAQLLHRLRRTDEAVIAFRRLVEEAPFDLHVRADYVAALLDEDRFRDAQRGLANVPDERRKGSGGLRLGLLEANLLARTLRYEDALDALVLLRKSHPKSPTVLAALAGAKEATGRWIGALEDYDRALSMDPENEDIQQARAYARSAYAPNAGMELSVRNVSSGESLGMSRISAESRWQRRVNFGLDYRRAESRANPTGAEPLGDGIDERAELFLRLDDPAGRWVRGAALVGGGAPGVSFELGRRSALSSTRLHAGYGLEYWDLPFAVSQHARRDRLLLSHESQWNRRFTSSLTGRAQHYRFARESSLRSAGFAGDATFRLRLGNPTLSLQYLVDAEYFGGLSPRLPLRSREVHALGAITSSGLTKHVRTDGLIGYSWDRLGGSSPFFGAYVRYDQPSGLNARFGFERRLYTLDTAVAETYWVARAFWRF